MRSETFFVPGRLPGLNEIVALRASKFRGAYSREKRNCQHLIMRAAKDANVSQWLKGAHLHYEFREPNRRRDPSNIAAGAIKFIEDALVQMCVLPDDGWQFVKSISYSWVVDAETPGVVVTLSDER